MERGDGSDGYGGTTDAAAGDRLLWRGQPAWVGYTTLALTMVAVPMALLVALLDRGGSTRALAAAGLAAGALLLVAVIRAAWRRTGHRYAVTTSSLLYWDIARASPAGRHLIPLAAVERVEPRQTLWQRALGVGDLFVFLYAAGDDARPAFRLLDVPEPSAVRRIIERRLFALAAASDGDDELDEMVRRVLAPSPAPGRPLRTGALDERFVPMLGVPGAVAALFVVALLAWSQGRRDSPGVVGYPADDPIHYTNGTPRPRAEVVRFMETEVMAFARQHLAPIVGGEEFVTCATCHGPDAEQSDYRMPAVSRLPYTLAVGATTRRSAQQHDVQVHNALVGELSDYDNAERAEYMRRVILPGMAALLRRPVYDRSRPYDYNRARHAFGCYHCHRLSRDRLAE
jgi:cytochrome c553